ncbi:hypothetical protein ACJJTC_018461 [Scirpophaga incertulas]
MFDTRLECTTARTDSCLATARGSRCPGRVRCYPKASGSAAQQRQWAAAVSRHCQVATAVIRMSPLLVAVFRSPLPLTSEVFDMLHSRDEDEDNMDLPNFAEDTESERFPIPDLPDAQAEFLQGPSSTVRKDAARYEVPRGEPFGAAAAIMVAITCAIVCLAYAALIVWRRIYL